MEIQKRENEQELLARLTKGSDFLPRLSLCHPLSKVVNQAGVRPGSFYLGYGEEAEELGKEVVVGVGPWRPHALLLVNNDPAEESFEPDSAVFQQIEGTREDKKKGIMPLVGMIEQPRKMPESIAKPVLPGGGG